MIKYLVFIFVCIQGMEGNSNCYANLDCDAPKFTVIDTMSMYKLWKMDTIISKEATMIGGIEHFQVLDLRDSTKLRMGTNDALSDPVKYKTIGNEIVILDDKGRPIKDSKKKNNSGYYILFVTSVTDSQLILSVNGNIGNRKKQRIEEFFEVHYIVSPP